MIYCVGNEVVKIVYTLYYVLSSVFTYFYVDFLFIFVEVYFD